LCYRIKDKVAKIRTPIVTVFVRHAEKCKYAGDEFSRRCNCRKHLRWTLDGVQHRRKTGTRSWDKAEEAKRELQDQLAGRTVETKVEDKVRTLSAATALFLKDKSVEGVSPGVIKKYTLELARLNRHCEGNGVYVVQGITRELLTEFCATWEKWYPSSTTRSKVRERLRSFLRYGYEAGWLERIPAITKVKVDEPPTMPLTREEYTRLLDALYVVNPKRWDGKQSSQGLTEGTNQRVRALIQLMRYSGLAISDALTLERTSLIYDAKKGVYRVVTSRQKTGTDVSVPIPPEVAEELLRLPDDNPMYFFWSGNGLKNSVSKTFTNRFLRPLFEAAGIPCDTHMVSHRLRDTFAVDLLEKGVPIEEVAKALGDTIRTTEKHYAKWVQGRQDRLDSLVMGTWGA
jgi:integrase